jgi:hypothetical protein
MRKPTGWVCSPVVGWYLPFDELLYAYNTTSTQAIGFVDNACFLQTGIDLTTVLTQVQLAVDRSVRWATDCGLVFCPKKTAMLIFTQKAKKSYQITKHLTLYGSKN